MNKNLLFIFVRNPELGKVKTRLAQSIGDNTALEVYKFLLEKTKKITSNLDYDRAIYYSEKIRNNDIWKKNKYQKFQQEGDDLGIRMINAFKNSFDSGYE